MNTRGLVITAWLVVGHAILGLLYWLLLQIPESNVFMLAGSVAVVIVMVLWAGAVEAAALLGRREGASMVSAAAGGLRRSVWIVPPAALFVVVWYLTGRAEAWLGAHRGEIDAWFLARWGWTDMSGLHTALGWAVRAVRWVLGGSMATAWLAAFVTAGAGAFASTAWLKHAVHWRTLLVVAGALLLGVWVPWRFVVDWRPASLPVSWVQPAFAAVKLGIVFAVMNTAWACILRRAARRS